MSVGENRGTSPKPEESLPVDLRRKKWNFSVGSDLFDKSVCVFVELNELFILQEKKI